MQLKFIIFRIATLVCVAGRLFCSEPTVLAPGNPPLTRDIAVKAAGFFEWALDVHFTEAQHAEYEKLLAEQWANESNRKSVLEMVRGLEKLPSVPEQKKQQVHQQVQDAMLDSLRKNSQSEDSRWLLAVYNAAHSDQSKPSAVSGQIVGKWRATKTSSVQYGNRATGALAPTNGSSFFYQFGPDGTYQLNGLMQVTTYGCSTSIYNLDSGTYTLVGDILTLEPATGSVKVQQNCGSTGNTDKPANLGKRDYRIHYEQQGGTTMLVTTDVAGKSRPDYFRSEK